VLDTGTVISDSFLRRRGPSLAGRIVLINVLAMMIIIIGLFYFGRYMDRLIAHEVESLTRQARLMASTLSEIAVISDKAGDSILDPEPTTHIIRRMLENSDVRVQVFTPSLVLAADSHHLKGSGRFVQIQDLAAPVEPPPVDTFTGLMIWSMNWLASSIPLSYNLSRYPGEPGMNAVQMPDLAAALKGETNYTLWSRPDRSLIITVTVPIQRLQQVTGVVMLTRGSNEISAAVHDLRMEILSSFSVVLGISILLSLYLAQTIARPLKRLARAALRARAITGGAPNIPDFSSRGDEIGDLSLAVRSMAEALWQRIDAIERFAADVSHELKNPLTSMKSALETLARVTDAEQKQRLFAIILEDVSRMDRLITDIAQASRLEAELTRTAPEKINLIHLLSALVTSRNQVQSPENRHLDLKVDQAQISIHGVPSRLVQIMENLIGNALSFSPPEGKVVIRAATRGNKAIVSVEDEGPGIPPEKLEKIFDRFYSSRPAGERFGTHSGLGLSICRQIAEGHGGRIYAENVQPHGAKFTLELPLVGSQPKT